jgi:hypothetical protein
VLRCRHEVLLRDAGYYLRVLERSAGLANGSHVWVHGHFAEAYARTRERTGAGAGMLGDFGEAFSKLIFRMPERGDLGDAETFLREFDRLPLPNYAPVATDRTLQLLRPDARELAVQTLRDRIRARFAEACTISSEPAAVGDHFFRWQCASCAATFQMFGDLRSVAPERNLMFDPAVLDLLARMPAAVRATARIGAHVVAKLHPAVALVPDANSLIPPGAPAFLHRLSKRMRPVLGKLRRRLFSDTYRTTASWPHLPLLMRRDPEWRARLEPLLCDGPLAATSCFDADQVRTAWREFLAGDLSRHHDVEKLAGLAVVLAQPHGPP